MKFLHSVLSCKIFSRLIFYVRLYSFVTPQSLSFRELPLYPRAITPAPPIIGWFLYHRTIYRGSFRCFVDSEALYSSLPSMRTQSHSRNLPLQPTRISCRTKPRPPPCLFSCQGIVDQEQGHRAHVAGSNYPSSFWESSLCRIFEFGR
jgi:hypothetical protein